MLGCAKMEMLTDIAHLLRQLFEETADYVQKHLQDVPKPENLKWHVGRENGERVLNYRPTTFPDYLPFLGNHSKEIEALPPFRQLREAVQSDARVSRAFLGTEGRGDVGWFLLFSYLLPITSGLLLALDEGKQLEAEVTLRIGLLDDFLKKDTLAVHLYAPLQNFRSSSENVELASGVRVCSLPDEKLEKYINSITSFMGGPNPLDLRSLSFQLESVGEVPRLNRYLPVNETEFYPKCQSLLRAFRLHRSGAIGLAFVEGDSEGPLGLSSAWKTIPRFERLYGEEYHFSAADAPAIADLHSRLKQVEKDQRFELAMRRFIGSYEKPFDGDRLVDHWIALEALLMPEKDTTELSYRVRLRAASFVGEPGRRKQVFEELRESYKARSKFVHGEPTKVDAQIVSTTEEHLRKALQRCLDLKGTPSREMLDSLILEP